MEKFNLHHFIKESQAKPKDNKPPNPNKKSPRSRQTGSKNLKDIRRKGIKRIRDRGIKWKEEYGERSKPLKKRFERVLGPGSYYRWEGHDYTTDSDYFIVVGPARNKDLKKRFFSGIKKIPKDPRKKVFAPDGEYFSTMMGALSHASEKWGIKMPPNRKNYTLADLENIYIPRHVKG